MKRKILYYVNSENIIVVLSIIAIIFVSSYLGKGNNIVLNFALSIIASFIFYLMTIRMPAYREKRYSNIRINYIMKDIYGINEAIEGIIINFKLCIKDTNIEKKFSEKRPTALDENLLVSTIELEIEIIQRSLIQLENYIQTIKTLNNVYIRNIQLSIVLETLLNSLIFTHKDHIGLNKRSVADLDELEANISRLSEFYPKKNINKICNKYEKTIN